MNGIKWFRLYDFEIKCLGLNLLMFLFYKFLLWWIVRIGIKIDNFFGIIRFFSLMFLNVILGRMVVGGYNFNDLFIIMFSCINNWKFCISLKYMSVKFIFGNINNLIKFWILVL